MQQINQCLGTGYMPQVLNYNTKNSHCGSKFSSLRTSKDNLRYKHYAATCLWQVHEHYKQKNILDTIFINNFS